MNPILIVWFFFGLLVGELHMRVLWAQTHRRPRLAWARGLLSVGFLVAAALLHTLFAAAFGWALGALIGVASRAAPGRAR